MHLKIIQFLIVLMFAGCKQNLTDDNSTIDISYNMQPTKVKEQKEFKKIETLNFDLKKIQEYKVLKDLYLMNNEQLMVIRSFHKNSKKYFLTLNLNTLRTDITLQNDFLKRAEKRRFKLNNTTFYRLSQTTLQNSKKLFNAGITSPTTKNKRGFYLTIDMCPSSKKGFEKEFFIKLTDLKKSSKKATPVSIAITYSWAKKHEKDFLWLLNHKNDLNITWINHSKTHFYDKTKEFSKNFMLHDKKSFDNEVLDVEKFLILNDETPSLFFRFPGLISDKELVDKLINVYSLIPLGTNNWVAKSKNGVKNGEIALIHGNLNESYGIKKMEKSLNTEINLMPLYDAFK